MPDPEVPAQPPPCGSCGGTGQLEPDLIENPDTGRVTPVPRPCPDCPPRGDRLANGTGPVVYLDVDGVVNLGWFTSPARFAGLRAAGWHAGRVTGDPTGRQEGFRVVLNPAWGPALLALADLGAELTWASGWNEGANLHVGPLLGLPGCRSPRPPTGPRRPR